MARRYYSSTAQRTTLTSGIGSGTTTIVVGSISGFPTSFPYTLILDADTASEELVEVTSGVLTSLTVVRGRDGTAATTHSAGADVRHGVSARDFDEPNAHVNATTGVHGVTGAVVGTTDTQSLTNKTINASLNTIVGVPADVTTQLNLKATKASPAFTGQVELPDGSAASPALTNTGDLNTGLWFPAADSVGLATNGVSRLEIDSAGAITGTGTSLGAWTLYDNVDSTTVSALGTGGTRKGWYCQIGRSVFFRCIITAGSPGFSPGSLTFPNPVTTAPGGFAHAIFYDSSASTYYLGGATIGQLAGGVITPLYTSVANGTLTALGGTVPFSWATGDTITVTGVYEA